MKMKTLITGLLVLSLLSATFACGKETTPNTASAPNATSTSPAYPAATLPAPEVLGNAPSPIPEVPPVVTPPALFPPPVNPGDITIPPDDVLYYHPSGLRWLTEDEKSTFIEIALNTSAVSELLKRYPIYQTSLGWKAIVWTDAEKTQYRETQLFSYDIVDRGVERPGVRLGPNVVTHGVSYSAMIYPCIIINFGEPKVIHAEVAIDLNTREVVNVTSYPVRIPPTIYPPP